MPSGNMAAMISPTNLPKPAPVSQSQTQNDAYPLRCKLRSNQGKNIDYLYTNKKDRHEGSTWDRHGGGYSRHPELKHKERFGLKG